jgi:hypothetical protein
MTIVGVQAFIIMGGAKVAADGHHAPVRELRRIVAARQLHSPGALVASERHGPAASASCPTSRRRVSVGRVGACDGAATTTRPPH